jgi:DMSO/TMAO reductase YedYZ molybdopterin-dependent catalytic subunit
MLNFSHGTVCTNDCLHPSSRASVYGLVAGSLVRITPLASGSILHIFFPLSAMDPTKSEHVEHLVNFALRPDGEERKACLTLDPNGFFIRHPPTPHRLTSFITPDEQLFQTIHMGAAVIDKNRYSITVDGLVNRPFTLSLAQLRKLPTTGLTAFHECYGSPLKPPSENV